ncbi:MAG: glycosyltransferase family 4 protein [Pseudomonadales bacterium]|nr:glycosyltransferase family 4 protein [Pseudomonadales bacterium]
MKILHLCRYYTPHIGGVETHVAKVSQQLRKKNHDIQVITQSHNQDLAESEVLDGILAHRLPFSAEDRKFPTWKWFWNNRELLFHADIIHIHDVFWWVIPLLPLLWYRQKKLYMTFHGYEGNENPRLFAKFWHWAAYKLTLGNICVGGFHTKWYGVTPTYITYGAVNAPKIKALPHKKNTLIAFVGRLEVDNGIMQYLKAFRHLAGQHTLHLDIFGDGSLRKKGENYAKKHDLPVTFHGFVPDVSEKIGRYEVVFASRYLSILEGLANECRVIAQHTNELQYDYLHHTPFASWICICASAEEIAGCLTQRAKVSSKAAEWACSQTWESMAKTYQTLWTLP